MLALHMIVLNQSGLITHYKRCCCNKLSTQLKHLSSVVGGMTDHKHSVLLL